MTTSHTDSPHSFLDAAYSREWVAYNERTYPQRGIFIEEIVRVLNLHGAVRHILELGGGAGRLAEAIQQGCRVEKYDLLDSSPAMLQIAMERLQGSTITHVVEADFSDTAWTERVSSGYDAIVTMQALHELRDPARVPLLYSQLQSVARPGAAIIVCDHLPTEARHRGLYMPPSAHLAAMTAGGLANAEIVRASDAMVIVRGEMPESNHGDDVFLWRRA